MVWATSRTFVNDLWYCLSVLWDLNIAEPHTIARIEFPDGPVTETQAPQFAELSQFESDSAVPRILEGRV